MRISNSFSEGEVAVLEKLVRDETLRPGSVVVRSAEFASLARKAQQMGDRARAQAVSDELQALKVRS